MICSTVPSRRRSSRMYCITGLPATFSIGFGVMCVCGRRRVPLPASGMITFMTGASRRMCHGIPSWRAGSFSSVAILESDDVVELWRADLEDVAVRDRLHGVHGSRGYAKRLSDLEPHVAHLAVDLDSVHEVSRQEVHGLVLLVVVLHGQRVPGVDMQHLAAIAVGKRPNRLVSPGFRDTLYRDGT